MQLSDNIHTYTTVWPELLAGNLLWRIGGFESNLPKAAECDVIIVARSYQCALGVQLDMPV